jgi:WD40 repeat protein
MEQAPLQIYLSALLFAPTRSVVRNQFKDRALQLVKQLPDIREDWSALLQTLEGHTDWVRAIAFTHDGKMLASASRDKTVRLWDPSTGQCLQTLEGHTDWVRAIAFTHDGKMLASASRESASLDKTVRLWDPSTGQCLQVFAGIPYVGTLSFSNDQLMLHADLPGTSHHLQQLAHALFIKETWITQHNQNLLWLPSEYRVTACTAIHDNNVALGFSSGQIIIFAFTRS